MICEECKKCFNYLVCESGCYGSTEPCEYIAQDSQDFCETLESVKKICINTQSKDGVN